MVDEIKEVLDYGKGLSGLPKSNVLKYLLPEQAWFVARPSGTEPKIKIYAMVQGNNEDEAKAQTEIYKNDIMKVLGIGE